MNYGRMSEWDRGDRGGDTGGGAQALERSVDTRSTDFNGYGLRDLSGHRKKVRSLRAGGVLHAHCVQRGRCEQRMVGRL